MRLPILFTAVAAAASLGAQNLPPVVTITGAVVDEGASTVTVTYDLSDPEGDPCTVSFRSTTDGVTAFVADVQNASGDLGPGIMPGTGYTITWNYTGIIDIFTCTVQVVADDGNAPSIADMVSQVTESQLGQRLANLAIPRHHNAHPDGIAAVRDSLMLGFEVAGLKTTTQDVVHDGDTVPNIIGRASGLYDDALTYVVDAHFDAVENTPGADDNATGVVGTLELARILGQYRFRNSIRFVGFAFEEQGLIGSGAYVQQGIAPWETIDGVLNFEMIGYYSDQPGSQLVPAGFDLLFPEAVQAIADDGYRGNFLTVVANNSSSTLLTAYLEACDTYVPDLRRISLSVPGNGFIAPDLRRSDHARFWDAGIKALMLTDGSDYRNPFYHTPDDEVGTIDLSFMANCTRATLAALATLAVPVNAGEDQFELVQLVGSHEHRSGPTCVPEVYPNPARDMILIQLKDCVGGRVVAELFDLKGNKVAGRDLLTRNGDARHELPLHGVAAGTYLLVLREGERTVSVKVDVEP